VPIIEEKDDLNTLVGYALDGMTTQHSPHLDTQSPIETRSTELSSLSTGGRQEVASVQKLASIQCGISSSSGCSSVNCGGCDEERMTPATLQQDASNTAAVCSSWPFINNGPLSAAAARIADKRSFYNFIVWDLGEFLPGIGIPTTVDKCTRITMQTTNNFIQHLNDLLKKEWKNPTGDNSKQDVFQTLLPTEMVSDEVVDPFLHWQTKFLGGKYFSSYFKQVDENSPSDHILTNPQHASKYVVLNTQFTYLMTQYCLNDEKLVKIFNRIVIDEDSRLLLTIQKPNHFVTAGIEFTKDKRPKCTMADSNSDTLKMDNKLAIATKLWYSSSKISDQNMAMLIDPLPKQKRRDCLFYTATYQAEKLTGTQLKREDLVWEVFTALYRVYAYLLFLRDAHDRGFHTVSVSHVLQQWLKKSTTSSDKSQLQAKKPKGNTAAAAATTLPEATQVACKSQSTHAYLTANYMLKS